MTPATSFVSYKYPEPLPSGGQSDGEAPRSDFTLTLKNANCLSAPFFKGEYPSLPLTDSRPWWMLESTFKSKRGTQDVLKAIELALPNQYQHSFWDLYNAQADGPDSRLTIKEGKVSFTDLAPAWLDHDEAIPLGGEVIIDVKDFLSQPIDQRVSARQSMPAWDSSSLPTYKARETGDFVAYFDRMRVGRLREIISCVSAWKSTREEKSEKSDGSTEAAGLHAAERLEELRQMLEKTVSSSQYNTGKSLAPVVGAAVDGCNRRRRWWGDEPHNSRVGAIEEAALESLQEVGVLSVRLDADGFIKEFEL